VPLAVPCVKGPGSIEEGITHLRSFDQIVIHPRCRDTLAEARLYSYIVNQRTGEITDQPQDSNNNWVDALRYALEPVRKSTIRDYGAML
jgi:phage terminase large subunit